MASRSQKARFSKTLHATTFKVCEVSAYLITSNGSKHWNIFCFAIFYVFGVLFFLRFYLIEDYVGKWKKLLTPSLIICFYFETFVGKGENFD